MTGSRTGCGADSPPDTGNWTELAASFLRIGTTVYGGMWGGVRELERELVQRRRWLSPEELRVRLVLSTLMPAPRFIGLAGLVGARLRGWWGGVLAVLSLLLPSFLMVLTVVMAVSERPLPPAVQTVQRWVSVAVVGVLVGNAWRHATAQPLHGTTRAAGVGLAVAVAVAVQAGVPLVAAVVGGLAAGWLLVGERKPR